MYIYIYIHTYIHTYIEREREREREPIVFMQIPIARLRGEVHASTYRRSDNGGVLTRHFGGVT